MALRNEVGAELEKYRGKLDVRLFETSEELRAALTGLTSDGESVSSCREIIPQCGRDDSLLIAATDATIALGRELGVAVMAYAPASGGSAEQMPVGSTCAQSILTRGQSFSGVDMIVEGFDEVDVNFLEKVYQRGRGIPWTIAETERCVIREYGEADLDSLFALYEDKELSRYTEELFAYDEEKEFQRAYARNMYRFYGYGMWLVFEKESGELIGRAGLEHRDYHGETELELGYLIGKKYQRQGYATEVCQCILGIARSMTDFPRINCLIDAENAPSIALAEKLGFSYVEDMEFRGRKHSRYAQNLAFF